MGIFDFAKSAGAKIGFGDGAKRAGEAAAASAEEAATAAEKLKARKDQKAETLAENKKAAGLETYVKELGLEIEDLDIRFDDGVATITGKAKDQESREKVILAVGNVADVGQVQDDIEVAAESAESKLHVVVSGDTLGAIAKTYYDDANQYNAIFAANQPMLSDPDKIYPGQVLRIPELAS